MDPSIIYDVVCQCGGRAEDMHSALLQYTKKGDKTEVGWPSCLACLELLNSALSKMKDPQQRQTMYAAMNAILNWPTLRLASEERKMNQTAAFRKVLKLVLGDVCHCCSLLCDVHPLLPADEGTSEDGIDGECG